ncbi:MAG: DNA repair protein RecO [Candidatus Pacebacteria bacterium]|nr:DNA repair protein RecO [Candidatus Paceibacterota bacterium]
MSTYKTEGIIIKRNNFLESSLILNIWTKDYGKVEAVARSARKAKGKLKGHLELFLDTELILAHGKNLDTITSSLATESFLNLRDDLEFSFAAYYILELVDRLTAEGHQDEKIFCLLKEVLLFLDDIVKDLSLQGAERQSNPVTTCKEFNYGIASSLNYPLDNFTPRNDLNLLILLFQTNLLNLTGFSPELNKCVLCGEPIKAGKNYFDFSRGGVLGSECSAIKFSKSLTGRCESSFISNADAREGSRLSAFISDNAIKLLRLFQFKGGDVKEYNSHLNKCFEIIVKLKVDEKLILDSVFLMNRFIEFNVEKKIKGIDFLRGV